MKVWWVYLVFFLLILTASNAVAFRVNGKVTYVGTLQEETGNGYQAKLRVQVSESNCGNDKTPKIRWIGIKSGRMDGVYQHNSANFRNAYNILMTSMLAGKTIEIDEVPSCNADEMQWINLWSSPVGVYK